MTWALESATGIWSNTGAGRAVVVSPSPVSGRFGVSLPCLTYLHEPFILCLASKDGRTAIEAAISGSNVVLRVVAFGGAASTITNTATDVPAGVGASVAHGLSAGVPFTLEARVDEGVIEVRINDAVKIQHQIQPTNYYTVTNAYGNLLYCGFGSAVNGAKIIKPQVYNLVPSEAGNQVEVLLAVCDGHVLLSEDGLTFSRIGTSVFNRTGPVSLTEHLAKVYGVDGTYRRRIDVVTKVVDNWAESSGEFPGSDAVAGQTRCRIATTFLGRAVVGGDPSDDRNATESASGDATDWDVDSLDDGAAWSFGTGFPGKIGSPITALLQLTRATMLIGCVDQTWRREGEAAFGDPQLYPVLTNSGVSGQFAVTMATGDVALFHGPPGLFMVGPAGDAVPLSGAILSTYIQVSREVVQDYRIIVIRDPERYLTCVFITPLDQSQGVHVFYDERTGGFDPMGGGFLPMSFPASVGPTAASVFRGKLVLGTWDGRLLKFNNAVKSDDGEAIESRVCLAAAAASRSDFEVEAMTLRVVLDNQSDDASVRYYSGRNAEEAAIGTGRALVLSAAVGPFDGLIAQAVRAPALSIEIWNTTVDRRWILEDVEVEVVEHAATATGVSVLDAYTPPALCGFPVASGGGDGGGDDGPGSGSLFVYVEESVMPDVTASAYDSPEPDEYTVRVISAGGGGDHTAFNAIDGAAGAGDIDGGTEIDEF